MAIIATDETTKEYMMLMSKTESPTAYGKDSRKDMEKTKEYIKDMKRLIDLKTKRNEKVMRKMSGEEPVVQPVVDKTTEKMNTAKEIKKKVFACYKIAQERKAAVRTDLMSMVKLTQKEKSGKAFSEKEQELLNQIKARLN